MAKYKGFLSTIELAEKLGISHVAVYKKIKNGQIKAKKIGRNYFIPEDEVDFLLKKELSPQTIKQLDLAVNKTLSEYGQTLKLLGSE